MGIKGWMLGLAAAGAAGEYGIARYFFHRTVVRGNAKAGQDTEDGGHGLGRLYSGYPRQQGMAGRTASGRCVHNIRDGLRLHGTFFCCEGSGRAVVCFHGYTSEGLNDYTSIAKFYLNQGFSLMVVDERASRQKQRAPISGLAV